MQAELSRPEGIRGVFGYYDKTVVETDELTQLADSSGKPIAGSCTPVRARKIVTVADQEHPIQIWYNYGLLEANQFKRECREGRLLEKAGIDGGAVAAHRCRAVGAAATRFERPRIRAIGNAARLAGFAFAAIRKRDDDGIAGGEIGDGGAHRLDDAGTLMAAA